MALTKVDAQLLNGAVTADSSGNVGIGTASPVDTLSLGKALDVVGTSGSSLYTGSSDSTTRAFYGAYSGAGYLGTYTNHPLVVRTNNTERMRIDSSGKVLINQSSSSDVGYLKLLSADWSISCRLSTASTAGQIAFYNTNGLVGSITSSGSTTAYVTSSDYRLKENIAPMVGALDKVSALKPVTYDWKDGGSSQGFIAHELQEVCPDAVVGEKDAVNEDGSIKPQGIDTSFLVATLTAAIQELKAELDATKAQLDESNLILTSVKTEVALLKAGA